MFSDLTKRYIFLFFLIASVFPKVLSQSNDALPNPEHEITIYVIPEVKPINWDTPADLLKSAVNCYIHAGLRKNYYVLGHIITKVSSPLLDSVHYFAMNGAQQSEKVSTLVSGKIGLGILGVNMQGRMEPQDEAIRSINFYAKRNKVAYIRHAVNEEAIKRVLRFVEYYTSPNDCGVPHSKYYNGALNPIYENEGAACSSFAIALLEVADILPEEAEQKWMVDINIPLDLIGGEVNEDHKVKWRRILKSKEWHDGSGTEGVDFAQYNVYDPDFIFRWIKEINSSGGNESFSSETDGRSPGLFADRRDIIYENDKILKRRDSKSFFVDYFFQAIKCEEGDMGY